MRKFYKYLFELTTNSTNLFQMDPFYTPLEPDYDLLPYYGQPINLKKIQDFVDTIQNQE